MNEFKIQVNGLPKLLKKLDAITREDVLRDGLYESGQYISGWIKKNRFKDNRDRWGKKFTKKEKMAFKYIVDPYTLTNRSGNLRSAIGASQTEKTGNRYISKIGLMRPVVYARVHEFGYPPRNIRPRPYLRPAIEDRNNQKEVIDIITERINTALRDAE